MIRFVLMIALAACARPAPQGTTSSDITNASCGGGCSTSGECGDIFSSCRSCYRGKCSAVLPAEPLDAGVDAAPGATTP